MDSSDIIGKEFNPQYAAPLSEQITEILTNSIIQGGLKEGQRLVENELQRKFGISRGPIRESFRILEKNGLVATKPRKGTYVRKISRKDIEDNFPIRAYLEGLAARLAISNLTSEDIQEMESALSKMTTELRNHNFESHLKYHSEFHEIICKASKNDTLIGIIQNLRLQATWFRFSYVYLIPDSIEYAIDVHRRILNYLIIKDPDGVEALMREHILITLNRFIRFLESQGMEDNR